MENFQNTSETRKRSFISVFSIYMPKALIFVPITSEKTH